MSSDNDENVIHIFPVQEMPENLLQISQKPDGVPYFCSHEAVQLDQHERTLRCNRCRATLDPFDFVLNNARTIQMAWENYRYANAIVAEINNRVGELKKEERRVRDRINRLQAKTTIINVQSKF